MTDPTLSPHKPPVIEDDRELIDRLMHQIVVREDDLYAALAANERLKAVLRGYEQWEAALISRKGRGEMSEMVEGVARALAPSSWAALGTGGTVAHKNRRTASLRHARKAIEAMRDYTPVVYDANGEVAHQLVGHPKSVWIMLMDAALSDRRGDA